MNLLKQGVFLDPAKTLAKDDACESKGYEILVDMA